MSTPNLTILDTVVVQAEHRIRLLHSATGDPISPLELVTTRWPVGWRNRVVGPEVVITRRRGAPAATATSVDVAILDGLLLHYLELPGPAIDGRPDAIRVPLTGPVIEVKIPPKPMELTVVLIHDDSDDHTGEPSVGRTVIARSKSGVVVDLTETATPGTYRSAPRVWAAAFNPADLRVGGTPVRLVSMDYRRTETRVHVVDPT